MRSLLCIKRDVEDTGFPEPKYEVWGFSDTVPYKRTSAHRYARTSARPLFTLAHTRKYQYVESRNYQFIFEYSHLPRVNNEIKR